jgi:VWFA-related protein
MRRMIALTLAGAAVVTATIIARAGQTASSPYLVEIDAVVIDEGGRPVAGLTQDDFQVRDDGRPVELKTFDAVADTGSGGGLVARSIVVLLDDSGFGPGNTLIVQAIARTFVARMAPPDEFSVVRLNNRRDEAFGDRLEALLRIDEYRSDALPFFGRETVENALRGFATVSRTLEAIEHRRKALVCIGVPDVCSVSAPASGRSSLIWQFWVDAVRAMGRANASVYSLEPNGSSRIMRPSIDGIAEVSGGELFRNTTDVNRAIDVVRRDTGTYYLLGYWPAASSRQLHTVEIRVRKPGLHVRARRLRGDAS